MSSTDRPAPYKKLTHSERKNQKVEAPEGVKIVAQFKTAEGELTGPPLSLPINCNPEQLTLLLNHLLQNEDPLPYAFLVNETEIVQDIFMDIIHGKKHSQEETIMITYQPQAIFKVRTVSRCTASISGHTDAILSVCFSPDGKQLASGSGDSTVRVWDLNTETPKHTLSGHTAWVQQIVWSPDCELLVSGSMDKTIRVWDPKEGKQLGEPIKGHTQPITSLAFEPYHRNKDCNRFVSSSKDGTAKIWNATLRKLIVTLAQHTAPIMCVKWGGDGKVYTASRDKSIKVWDPDTGKIVRSLDGHAHWVNHLALSTDFVLRTGPFDHTDPRYKTKEAAFEAAKKRYESVLQEAGGIERLASGSDDFTLFLWEPSRSKKPIARMTGHQQPVNHLSFSPNGVYLASASFDKHVKLWDSKTGTFVATLHGHVNAVYQVCWSSDSRQLLSGSQDSTLKVWDLKTKKLKMDLPGHADAVYAVDWSPAGDRVASGGKDKILKIWRH
ncbi:quinon protein alcohol dehydrogenase-like superfamily [Gorgonomyces haynaldii]|nr:quinon protein alcohol dehydrogenase-like superfamily [Gorgonomyces haynaldii]